MPGITPILFDFYKYLQENLGTKQHFQIHSRLRGDFFEHSALFANDDPFMRIPLTNNHSAYFCQVIQFFHLFDIDTDTVGNLIPQIEQRDLRISKDDLGRAVTLIAGGIIKYAVIAKSLGVLFVAPAFAGELGDSGIVALMAIYGFTLQIYCDFSGYSDIAIGVALLLGFRLPDNFDAPYKSATITEFWRRWHISLSTWLKEYLYISLGGNRHGTLRTYLNLIVTMFLGGLWHGVGLTFMAWGLLHGVALALHKLWLKLIPNAKKVGSEMKPAWRVLATLLTFHIVAFGWLLFTADSMHQVEDMLMRIAHNWSWADIPAMVEQSEVALALMLLGYVMHLLPRRVDNAVMRGVTRSGYICQVLLIVVAVWLMAECDMLLTLSSGGDGALPMYAAF